MLFRDDVLRRSPLRSPAVQEAKILWFMRHTNFVSSNTIGRDGPARPIDFPGDAIPGDLRMLQHEYATICEGQANALGMHLRDYLLRS
jgi:hypothetical protein